MAEVWKARVAGPRGFARTVVVKRVLPHLVEDLEFVRMFLAEAKLSARLVHANIVSVFDLGDSDGQYYLAMEYVRGKDLIALLRASAGQGPLPVGFAAFVVREVCRALDYAHNLTGDDGQPLRLIHRDVSPSNVMIGFDGGVKLLDFGVAKALAEASDHRTATGTLKGKFAYMAPEQVETGQADHRADLFAAAVILHELLCNRRLFRGANDLETIQRVRATQVPRPSTINPAVPPGLDEICAKALARDPQDRYASGGELAVALDEIVHTAKWGPERLAAMMRGAFPAEPMETGTIQLASKTPDSTSSNAIVPAVSVSSSPAMAVGRMRTPVRAALVVLVVLLANVIVWWATRPAFKPAISVAAAPAPAPTPVLAPALPSQVSFMIGSQPPGAEVFLDDEPQARGRTPTIVHVQRDPRTVRVKLTLEGYVTATTELMARADAQVQHAFVKQRRPAKTSSTSSTSSTSPKRGASHSLDRDSPIF